MLNEILRVLRIANDLKITELSNLSKVSRSYITEIEKGYKTPSISKLESLAKVFGISVSQILYFDVIATENNYTYRDILLMILEYYVENNHVFNNEKQNKRALVK